MRMPACYAGELLKCATVLYADDMSGYNGSYNVRPAMRKPARYAGELLRCATLFYSDDISGYNGSYNERHVMHDDGDAEKSSEIRYANML